MEQTKIFAIIVTYNAMRRNWIEKCLVSIEASTVPMTAIVIDNGSTDETRSFVPQRFPNTVWLPQEKNLGFGQANNLGMRYALDHGADYVLLLNQDATIGQDAIEKMLACSDGQTLLSPLQLNGVGSQLDAGFKKCLMKCENMLFDDALVSNALQATYSGPVKGTGNLLPAACWLMPVAVLKSIGGFNPLFFQYGEDDNYFQRLFYHRIPVRICPKATMCHDRGEHGNVQTYNNKKSRRLMLRTAVDINLSFAGRLKEWLQIIKNSYTSDLRRGLYRPGDSLSAMFWLLGKVGRIRQSRTKERSLGPTWL